MRLYAEHENLLAFFMLEVRFDLDTCVLQYEMLQADWRQAEKDHSDKLEEVNSRYGALTDSDA